MKIKTIQTKKVPAVGPYSQAVIFKELIFTSGQIGINVETGKIDRGIEKQTHQMFSNLKEVLKNANSDFEHVIKTTVYLKNISDFALVNEIYASYFKHHKPARTTIEAAKLPKDALIEIDCIAVKK